LFQRVPYNILIKFLKLRQFPRNQSLVGTVVGRYIHFRIFCKTKVQTGILTA